MTATKRKPARRGKRSPAAKGPRSGSRPPVAAELPLRQGLLEMATIGAQSVLWLATVLAILAGLAGAAFGIWSLRPVPAYSSVGIRTGSPFAVTFGVQNTSAWFPLSHLKVTCVLTNPDMAVDVAVRLPDRLAPGESASFTCPFRGASDDLDAALRSEIYFHSEYDLPMLGTLRLTDNRGPLVIDTRQLPPRWTAKPAKD